ncbi:MAG: tetratricopeptide repeat protein [Candidatus Eisenbacteria bacterium]
MIVLGAAWSVAVAIALLARIRVLGELFALGPVTQTDNVLAHVGTADRILTALYVQAYSFGQLVWPRSLSPDYSYPEIVPTSTHSVIGAVFGVAVLALLAWALVRRDRAGLWGLVFTIATWILTSNLVFPIGTVYGERLAYLPSVGSIWLLVLLAGRALRQRTVAIGLTAAVVVALGVRSAVRAPEWKTNVTLFEAATHTSSRSAKTWTNAALALIKEGRIADGMERAQRAIELDPKYAPAIQAVGSALVQLGRPNEAIPWLEQNRGLAGKRGTEALIELGNAQLALEDGEKALAFFSEARSRSKPDDERWMVGLASAYALESSWSESVRYWQNAVSIKPEDPAFRQRFAYVLWQDGDLDRSEELYRGLWNENQADPERANELAWFLAVTERNPEEALRLAEGAYGRRPDANIADTWLEAWLRARGCEPARAWLEGATFPAEIRQPLEAKLSGRCAHSNEGDESTGAVGGSSNARDGSTSDGR